MHDSNLKKLIDNKRIDSIQFYLTCQNKLAFADCNLNSIKTIIEQFKDEKLKEHSVGKITWLDSYISYFDQELPHSFIITKLTDEFFSHLHNFFDIFAQWLNAILFGEDAIVISKVNLFRIVERIYENQKCNEQLIFILMELNNSLELQYICDWNNSSKHRYQLKPQLFYDIFTGCISADLPYFVKENNQYDTNELLPKIQDCFYFCKKMFLSLYALITDSYPNHPNCVSHRKHNPKLYINNNATIKNPTTNLLETNKFISIHYFDIDPLDIQDEYLIALYLYCEIDKSFEIKNCDYPLIALRDKNCGNYNDYIGILKPATNTLNNPSHIEYRVYKTLKKDYEIELYKEMIKNTYIIDYSKGEYFEQNRIINI